MVDRQMQGKARRYRRGLARAVLPVWPLAAVFGALGAGYDQPVHAETIRDDVPDSQYISLSTQSRYAAEGYVAVLTSTSGTISNFNVGTGTLIAPDWILTAAHILTMNNTSTPYSGSSISFGQGTTANFPTANFAAQVQIESGFVNNSADLTVGNDLALIQLATPITNVNPAVLYNGSLPELKTQTATVIGYGDTGNGLTGDTGNLGTRRGMQNVVDAYGGDDILQGQSLGGVSPNLAFTDFDSPNPADQPHTNFMGSPIPLPLEGSTAAGDSGGGLFVTVGGNTYLAGVTSFGAHFLGTPVAMYGDVNAFTRVSVSQSMQFINSFLIVNSNWNLTGGGTWNSLNSWDNSSIPEYQQASANFGSAIIAPSIVRLDANWTIGAVTFNNANSYTITAGTAGSLTLDNGTSSATVTNSGGSHTISAPVTLNSNLLSTVANAGNTTTFSGPISGNAGITTGGAGTTVLAGTNTYIGPTSVMSGSLNIGSSASLPAAGATIVGTVSTTAKLVLVSGIGTVTQSALTVNTGSTVDLTTDALLLKFGSPANDPVAGVLSELSAAYNGAGGRWTGPGLTSSSAAANPGKFTVGYADGNADAGYQGNISAANQLIVKYTIAGDANLDGKVNIADLAVIAQNYNQSGRDYAHGNLVYAANGLVGLADLALIAQNYNQSLSSSESAYFSDTFLADWHLALAQVNHAAAIPEPTSATLAAIAVGGLLGRRRVKKWNSRD